MINFSLIISSILLLSGLSNLQSIFRLNLRNYSRNITLFRAIKHNIYRFLYPIKVCSASRYFIINKEGELSLNNRGIDVYKPVKARPLYHRPENQKIPEKIRSRYRDVYVLRHRFFQLHRHRFCSKPVLLFLFQIQPQ